MVRHSFFFSNSFPPFSLPLSSPFIFKEHSNLSPSSSYHSGIYINPEDGNTYNNTATLIFLFYNWIGLVYSSTCVEKREEGLRKPRGMGNLIIRVGFMFSTRWSGLLLKKGTNGDEG